MENIEGKTLSISEEMGGNTFRITTSGPEEAGNVIIKICEAFDPNFYVGLYTKETKNNPVKAYIESHNQERPEGAFAIYALDENTVIAQVRNGQGSKELMDRLKEMIKKALD